MGIFRLVALFSIVPGASHLSIQAYSHFGVYFYLVSFVVIGIIQIILGIRIWKGEISNRAFWAATLINGIATVFWLLTRMMYAPFMGGIEHFSVLGVIIGSLQILFVGILCFRRGSVRDTLVVLALSIVLGFAVHAGAMLMEKVFPVLKGTGSHAHGHSEESTHEEVMAEEASVTGERGEKSIESSADVVESEELGAMGKLDSSDEDPTNDSHEDGDSEPHGHE